MAVVFSSSGHASNYSSKLPSNSGSRLYFTICRVLKTYTKTQETEGLMDLTGIINGRRFPPLPGARHPILISSSSSQLWSRTRTILLPMCPFCGFETSKLKINKIKISIKPSGGFWSLSVLWNKCSRFIDGSSLSHVRRVRRVIQHGDALHSQELSRDSGNRGKREIMLPQLRISLCRHSGPNWSEKLIGCIWELWRQQSWNFSSGIFSEKAKKHPSKY